MSISGLYLGTRALAANQIALEVTGQNISNVNTEGYTRQRAHLSTTESILRSYGVIGTGVKVDGIERIRDAFVDLEIRNQNSTVNEYGVRAETFAQLEGVFDEASGAGIDSLIQDFFDSLNDIANSPEDVGLRTASLLKADTLGQKIQFVDSQLNQLRLDVNEAMTSAISEANNLLNQVADLNTEIVKMEAGTAMSANDLRDKRDLALKELSGLINIKTYEMESGEVSVSVDGINVVFGGTARQFGTEIKSGDDLPVHNLIVEGSGTTITPTGGKIAGYLEARDTDIPSYINKLDELARGLIDEVNKLHVNGRGLRGFSDLTSASSVSDSTVALTSAGLTITPVNTSFNLTVIDKTSGTCVETAVPITINVGTDSLDDVAANINSQLTTAGITDITATVTSDNKLNITSSDEDITFAFGSVTDDTNNFLSAIGLNTFFTGSDASDIAVNPVLLDGPEYFAAATTGAQGDNSNALSMTDLRAGKVLDGGTKTFSQFHQALLVTLGSNGQQTMANYEASNGYLTQLNLKRESVSGVNLDEEAANLIIFQRAYEASARYISVVDQMLNVLVNGLV